MYDWNSPARVPDVEMAEADEYETRGQGDPADAIDRELEAAIEYKLAMSGFAGIAEIMDVLDRSVRRRWVRGNPA